MIYEKFFAWRRSQESATHVLLGLTLSTASAAAMAAEPIPVKIGASGTEERSGVLVAQAGQCAVLTAAHDIDAKVELNVNVRGKTYSAHVVWNGLKSTQATDIAVLRIREPIPLPCSPLSSAERISAALTHPYGQIWLAQTEDQLTTVTVSTTFRNDRELSLELASSARALAKGTSGAPVVFDGQVVAILTKNQDPGLTAARLDHLLRMSGDETRLRRIDLVAANKFPPYHLEQLPQAVADEVRRARQIRGEVESLSKVAADVERRADEAAQFAEGITMGQYKDGHARFHATNGNYYAGQVEVSSNWFSTSGSASSRGYGVSITGTGPYKGETSKCAFAKNAGCTGTSIRLYSDNSNWKRVEYESTDKAVKGPAKIFQRSGRVVFASIRSQPNDEGGSTWSFFGAGVVEYPDGSRYEGQLDSGRHGLGVLWQPDGALAQAGVWKNDTFAE